jgi:LPS-assembly lipoprotein
MPGHLPRRTLLAAATTSLLAGCGFALRQTPPLPFERIALTGFDAHSPLAAELREQLAGAAKVVATPAQADVVLQSLVDRRERSVVASTAAGQVRELQLRISFEFRLLSAGGRELVSPTELLLSRDMSYSETVALAKAQEETELYAAMQSDIVQQVLRRLARADLQPPRAAAPAAAAASRP